MPIDYSTYHPDWKDIIRPDILRRDNYKCIICGAKRRQKYVLEKGSVVYIADEFQLNWYINCGTPIKTIHLAIAHLDLNKDYYDYINLATMCQRHHLAHDKHQHALSRITKKK